MIATSESINHGKDVESGEMKIERVKESRTVIGGLMLPELPRRVETVGELVNAHNLDLISAKAGDKKSV